MPSQWLKIRETQVYKGWRGIIQKEFELPGQRRAVYDVFDNATFVTVAAQTVLGDFILVRQFRPGPEMELLSFVEGYVDAGESPEEAALRELMEEAGYEAESLVFLKEKRSAYSNERQLMFLASGCRETGKRRPDPDEFIEVVTFSVAELKGLMRNPGDNTFCNIDAAYLALEALGESK